MQDDMIRQLHTEKILDTVILLTKQVEEDQNQNLAGVLLDIACSLFRQDSPKEIYSISKRMVLELTFVSH